jgi:hypothetical protein
MFLRPWYVGHYVGMYTARLSLILLKLILSGLGFFYLHLEVLYSVCFTL